jgi:thioredoxin-related protein
MKRILYTLTIIFGLFISVSAKDALNEAEEIFGKISFVKGSYENFMISASSQNKPLMLLFFRPGCHTCNHLKKSLSKNDVGEYFNRYFYSYFVNTDDEKFKMFPLSEKFGAKATPYFVFLTPDGKVIYKGTINPDKDSVLEKCTQIIIKNNNYLAISNLIKNAVTPEEQTELASKLVKRFESKLAFVNPQTMISSLFLTGGLKNYKVFNDKFMALASGIKSENNSPFKVDEVTASNEYNKKVTCSKKSAKWQKWLNE